MVGDAGWVSKLTLYKQDITAGAADTCSYSDAATEDYDLFTFFNTL